MNIRYIKLDCGNNIELYAWEDVDSLLEEFYSQVDDFLAKASRRQLGTRKWKNATVQCRHCKKTWTERVHPSFNENVMKLDHRYCIDCKENSAISYKRLRELYESKK